MISAFNSEAAIQKRKCQDILKLCGGGMILFGFWAIAKFLLQVLTDNDTVLNELKQQSKAIRIFTILVTAFLILFDFVLRIYVCRSANHVANGKKTGNAFIVITVFMLLVNFAIFFCTTDFGLKEAITATFVMQCIIDLTDDAVMAALLVQTFRLHRLNKLAGEAV